ncbi:MAG: radical SAM family heme chaperone HemW [Aquificaceae bacterium]|nr:radical SAM family heme chaperone HemW [Aquificaceae bacterium]MDW8096943.1 radical SAM family heme chaperone HemW [Aquificaceae bacterium]
MVKGLYFHVPFCSYKCPYCDFVSVVGPQAEHGHYMELLLKELSLYEELEFSLQTLYFGGGTPSLVSPKTYEVFLQELSKLVDLSRVEEITIECNPENYSLEEFRALRELGFNRVSLGVQSLREEGLKALGRRHSLEQALRSVHWAAEAGFERLNVDLIYGYQGQTPKELERELDLLLSLPVSHVSLYMLTPYEDTLFGQLYRKGALSLPDGDTLGDMFELACDKLESAGFVHYEVSNFALPGYECRHNLLYWTHQEFLGLGVSAWSFVKSRRFGNTRSLKLYEEKLKKGTKPVEQEERLEGREKLYDYLFVALRTRSGVPRALLGKAWQELKDFFQEEGDRVRLNRKGMLLLNEVLLRLKKHLRDNLTPDWEAVS